MRKLLLACMIAIYVMPIFGMDIGSDTAVTRFNNLVTINNGDRVAGFASLDGGFALSGANVVATWDSFFPVSGTLSWGGGILLLNRDLNISNVSEFALLGDIVGNGHTVQLPAVDQIPAEGGASFRCAPYFVSEINNGGVDAETLSWNYTEDFLATFGDSGAGVSPGLIAVYEIVNDVLVLRDTFDTGDITAVAIGSGDIRWHPSKNIFALARNTNSGTGDGLLGTYSFDGTTITEIDTDTLTGADGRAASWNPDGTLLAVGTLVTGSEVRVYPVDTAGNLGTFVSATIPAAQDVQYASIQFDTTGDYFVVGLFTDSVNPELLIYEVATGPLSIVGVNASTTIGSSIGGLDWGKGPDFLAIGLVAGGATTDDVRVYSFDDGGGGVGNGTLTLLASTDALGRTTQGVSWESLGECFSISTDGLAGEAFFNTYEFDGSSLNLIGEFIITGVGDIDLEATRWGPAGAFAAVSGDDDIIRIYAIPAGTCYVWSDVTLLEETNTLYTDVCLTFTGQNVWSGRGCCVDFSPTTTIFIDANSELMFRDMTIRGLRADGIVPLDSSTTTSFNNVRIELSSDYEFETGHLAIVDDVEVVGDGLSFIFTSTVPARITSDSRFIFNKGTTFRYEPSDDDRNNFVLDDATAEFVFDSATFATSGAGLQLTKGKISFDGLSTIVNEGSSLATSLELGDGLDSANNVCVRWLPASNVELMQGQLRLNNV